MLLIPWLLDGDDVFGRHNRRSEPRGATKPSRKVYEHSLL
jgi:hypothetical protein